MEHAFTFHDGNYTVRTYYGAVLIIALSHLTFHGGVSKYLYLPCVVHC